MSTDKGSLPNDSSAYRSLRQAIGTRSSPVVALVGSGLSAPAGLPAWPELRRRLIRALRDKAATASPRSEVERLAAIADKAGSEGYWVSFEILRRELGEATYKSELRDALTPAADQETPRNYERLWNLPLKGIVSLNLDSFARRAFSSNFPGRDLKDFLGRDAHALFPMVHGSHPFTFNLHGNVDDSSSWVFTQKDLAGLYDSPGYQELIRTIFTTCTVVFIGISADDEAIGGPLERIQTSGIEGPTHYWLTHRADSATDRWAEGSGIRVVHYNAPDGDHSMLGEILDDLAGAVGVEPTGGPVVASGFGSNASRPTVEALLAVNAEDQRLALNQMATSILDASGGVLSNDFVDLVEEYEEVIHQAEYATTRLGRNLFFGHKLLGEAAKGAFGRVYEATDPTGARVAVKILRQEVRSDPALLASYRRGVDAMRILGEARVEGMVPYRMTSELPPFVSMDWIDGPTFQEAKSAKFLEGWADILVCMREAASVVRRAHVLPQGVLHRDLRPANIMLQGGWSGGPPWDVVVLDFDLATHQAAQQASVLAEESAIGYLAPEQLMPQGSASTRSTLVDVFGLGMTFYYLCGGVEPESYIQRRATFDSLVSQAVASPEASIWKVTPKRAARLIRRATNDVQSARCDLVQFISELDQLIDMESTSDAVNRVGVEVLAEEMSADVEVLNDYAWDPDSGAVEKNFMNGAKAIVRGDVERRLISVSLSWAAKGEVDRSNLGKYSRARAERAVAVLRKVGWQVTRTEVDRGSVLIRGQVDLEGARSDMQRLSGGLGESVACLAFE